MLRARESGVVSLFVVIITTLLVTAMTVAFIRIMIQGQEQAQANDLSKSALDSAYGGVEDAKRALVEFKKKCPNGEADSDECLRLATLMNGEKCNALQVMGISGQLEDKEVVLKQNEGDELLQQAYTCVKIMLDTPDYVASLNPNVSRMLPLKSKTPFDRIEVQWYSQNDLQAGGGGADTIKLPDLSSNSSLPREQNWPKNQPAMLRLQMIQYADSFKLSSFNDNDAGNSNNSTLFLMPSVIDGSAGLLNFNNDIRKRQGNAQPVLTKCNPSFSTTSSGSLYACKASISMPNPVGASNGDNRTAFLRVGSLYNPNTSVRITLWSGANQVLFNNVQPAVDSTGRANNLFRRINTRIDIGGGSIPQAEAAVDITGSLCKNYVITDTSYSSDGGCTP